MKFTNYKEYKEQRDTLIGECEALLAAGKTDEYKAKTEEVKALDNDWDVFAQEQANIEALKGAAKAPLSTTARGNVVDSFTNEDKEYRMAFMNYVLKGTPIPMSNSDATTVASDVGAVIPNTILNKIIEKMENVGGVYGKMTKTFYKGGVTVPTSSAKPVATWTSERGTTDKQKKTVGSITFAYHKLRCVVACSIVVDNVTLDIFENTISQNIANAMVKAIENAGFNGTGGDNNQPEGILLATVPTGQTIDITEGSSPTYANICAAEGALPEEYEDGAEWYMKKTTFFNQFQAMVDSQGQPIAKTNAGIAGKPEYYLLGRKVNFVSYVPAFATSVTADTKFAVMFNFEDYLFNCNLQISMKEYEDHDSDDQIKKAIMLADGKPIDLNSLVVMQVKNS